MYHYKSQRYFASFLQGIYYLPDKLLLYLNLRIHDLRRSLGSWQAATGANLSVIGKTLAHKNVSTTAIYARLNIDPIRESMNKATDAILNAAGVGDIKTKS